MKNLGPTRIALPVGLMVALLCATGCGGNMAGDFAVNFPTSAILPTGSGTLTLMGSIHGLNGFNGKIALATTGVPDGATLTFSPPVVAPGLYSMNLSASDVAPGTYTITFLFTSGHLQHTSTLGLQVQ